ncbi:unnamed protein product [Rotaria sp. Silwood2]|nr:unnamed protein product [Rotaria sp. Silwood2]CAF3978998.1 unnamed protein product [Rotaria sp. Silwood2]
MPYSIRNKYSNFSIARRPLNFDEDDTTVLSVHMKKPVMHIVVIFFVTKFPNYPMRDFHRKYSSKRQSSSMKIHDQLTDNQTFTFEVSVSETHAFIRHINTIPSLLRLPSDMFIPTTDGMPFETRTNPVSCRYLKIRKHNKKDYPHITCHGTSIKDIELILMDGLVILSMVVSIELRICPAINHIA